MTLVETRPRARLAAAGSPQRRLLPVVAVGLLTVLAGVHAVVAGVHYHVGSFDDDGHYLALAQALEHGRGFVDTSVAGAPPETLYPPGYPALLVPLLWLSGGALWALRALSLVALMACVPLTDRLLRARGMATLPRITVLALFALNPVAATFGTMVMPETVFLVVLLVVLLAVPRWEAEDRLLTPAGVAVAVGAPWLLLLKSAGLPMLLGVVGWLALRRHLRKAAAVVVTSAVLLTPVLALKVAGGSLLGDRNAYEYARGGPLLHRVLWAAHHYVSDAIPAGVFQWFTPTLTHHGLVLRVLVLALRWSAAALVAAGWVAWLRRRPDATVLIVPLYLAETLPFPYINERRIILLLPLVIAWYVAGWTVAGRAARGLLGRLRRDPLRRLRPSYAAAVPLALLVPLLAVQFPRDYLLGPGENTSAPEGSGYAAAVRAATPPGWNVATSYRWTMALVSGRTATNDAHLKLPCRLPVPVGYPQTLHRLLVREHVATVLTGNLNRPLWLDSACILHTLSNVPWAVAVYHGADDTTLFDLLGPGTPRAAQSLALSEVSPPSAVTRLPHTTRVAEVSVEVTGAGRPVLLQLRGPDGAWSTLATTRRTGPVLLLARLAHAMPADAVRVVGGAPGLTRDLVVFATAAR